MKIVQQAVPCDCSERESFISHVSHHTSPNKQCARTCNHDNSQRIPAHRGRVFGNADYTYYKESEVVGHTSVATAPTLPFMNLYNQ